MNRSRSAVLVLTCALCIPAGCDRAPVQPNLLLITIDTIRPDHLGCEGYERAETPVIDDFASNGVHFLRCTTPVPITLPSHATILTGLTPLQHGARDNTLYKVPEENETLAEVLQRKGYSTAAFISGQPLTSEFGLNQGFDHYDDDLSNESVDGWSGRMALKAATGMTERTGDHTASAAIRWLEENPTEPFFVWVHFFDPHQAYQPPPPYSDTFFDLPYDGEIAFVDEQIGRIFAALDDTGVLEQTSVIITGDHGEGLMEHNELTHATLAYDSTLRVPLMWQLVGDDAPGKRINDEVALMDILPTLADHLGFETPAVTDGVNLLPLVHGEDFEAPSRFFENESTFNVFGWAKFEGMRDGSWKYIHSVRDELYKIDSDPGETENLIDAHPEIASRLRADLDAYHEHAAARAEVRDAAHSRVSDDVRDRLAALGYLGPSEQVRTDQTDSACGFEQERLHPADHVRVINEWSMLRMEVESDRLLDAEARLRYLLAFDPNNTDFLDVQALVLGQTGREAEAIEIFETLMANGIAKPRHLRNLAMLYRELDRFDEANELFTLCLDKDLKVETRSVILAQLAEIRKQLGDIDGSLEVLRDLSDLRPGDYEARRRRAVIWYRRGDVERAEGLLEEALACNPYHAKSHQNLAAIRMQQGRFDDAVEHARVCVRVAPQYLEGRLTLGLALIEQGHPEEARMALEELLDTADVGTVAEKARGLLEQIATGAQTSGQ